MTLTILSDSEIRTLLHTLDLSDVQRLQRRLGSALHEYSTGTQATSGGCSANQPPRTHVTGPDGQTTLFMPARTGDASGVKIVTLSSPTAGNSAEGGAFEAEDLLGTGSGDDESSTNTTTSGTDSPRGSYRIALRPSDSSSTPNSGRSSPAPPPANAPSLTDLSTASSQPRRTSPQGSLTLLRSTGEPLALINAAELTAFRTALASTLLFTKRKRVHSIAVFGAGKQAYWHLRLALILRGEDIHHVRLINRTFSGAAPLLRAIYEDASWDQLRHANPKLGFSLLSADYGEYARLLKEYVRDADALFCCTPSTVPLFPAGHLTRAEGRRKGRYLALVGSYAPHMREVHPDVLKQAIAPNHGHHHHKHAPQGGVIVVDGLDACLHEAGEVIEAGIRADQLVELGEIIMVKRAAMKEVEMGKPGEPGLVKWLQSGNVVYKSVGLGLMDLAVGEELVDMARERGIGTTVVDF
jgi:ornithine cyclodeaminase/alanine dehydrogenase-like protein (mu-crystallin family)